MFNLNSKRMNKKFLLGMFAAAGMLLATSCSNDELIEQGSGDTATVSFTINTEGAVASRAISDGGSATVLKYQVLRVERGDYEVMYHLVGDLVTDENFNGSKTIQLQLGKGQEYAVGFWAESSEANKKGYYEISSSLTEGMSLSINYDKILNNNENSDAFFGNANITVSGNETMNVTLKRPFAQINVGASDYKAFIGGNGNNDIVNSSVVIKNAATTLNLLNGDVSGNAEVTFNGNHGAIYLNEENSSVYKPTQLLTVNETEYTWLSMCYVLPQDKEQSTTVSAEFGFEVTAGNNFTLKDGLQNLPIQRNYRTNIIGSLLTNSVDFKVVIDSKFQEPDHNVDVWDGVSDGEKPSTDETGAYVVKNAANWIWLTKNGTDNKNIKLDADINFNGNAVMTMVMNGTAEIDGQGHTLSNLVITYNKNHSEHAVGLVMGDENYASPQVVKNLTVTAATIDLDGTMFPELDGNIDGFAGVIYGDVQDNKKVTLENVHVKNSKVKGVQSVAGLVGFVASGAELNLKNCSVEKSHIDNYCVANESGFVCGLVGKVVGTLNIVENVSIKNTEIYGIYADIEKRGIRSIDAVAATYNETTGTITGYNNVVVGSDVIVKKFKTTDTFVSTAADLVTFANKVNSGKSYAGEMIVINSDIDLKGIDWQPIGQTGKPEFRGVIEGNGYTIYNLTINQDFEIPGNGAGFIGWTNHGATVRNLNFENANVTGSHYVGVVCGYHQLGEISNCKVNNSKVNAVFVNGDQDGDKCGGAIGFVGPNANIVKNIVVTNTSVKARRNAAQVIGYCYPSNNTIQNLSASNVTVEYNGNIYTDGNDNTGIVNALYGPQN